MDNRRHNNDFCNSDSDIPKLPNYGKCGPVRWGGQGSHGIADTARVASLRKVGLREGRIRQIRASVLDGDL